jgi:hypothetical protein
MTGAWSAGESPLAPDEGVRDRLGPAPREPRPAMLVELTRLRALRGGRRVIGGRPHDAAGLLATVRRIGMEWVGETEKYHGLRLQQYRLRPGDLKGPRSHR